MDTKTLKALWQSIEHWHVDIWDDPQRAKDLQLYQSSCCNLCLLFLDNNCVGCPVFEKTRWSCCLHTPWGRVKNTMCDCGDFKLIKTHIEKEIEFLVDLLPDPIEE